MANPSGCRGEYAVQILRSNRLDRVYIDFTVALRGVSVSHKKTARLQREPEGTKLNGDQLLSMLPPLRRGGTVLITPHLAGGDPP